MRRRLPILLFALALCPRLALAQDPDQVPPPAPPPADAPQSEHDQLQEEFIRFRAEEGQSHASGGRPELGPTIMGNPTQSVVALRVGLNATTFTSTGAVSTEFASLHHAFVDLTNTDGDVKVIDRSTGKEITVMSAGSRVHVEHDGLGFLVTQDDVFVGSFAGPVFFRPDSAANLFRVESIRRTFGTTQRPLYRGAIEVARGRITAAILPPRVNLVNIVAVEDYVPGVVANESIASFAIEALKAQAVAARGYAIANVGNYVARGYPFDIVDSSASQVYRGVISEHVNAVRAASDTYGLVASTGGRIISAMYSSSFGGHSESNEWISFTAGVKPGGSPQSHLRGIYDGLEPAPDFSSTAGIDGFWRANPPSPLIFDECSWTGNGFSRWRFVLSGATIKSRLTTTNATLISGVRTGTISDVAITERMGASKRALVAQITLSEPAGVLEVRGWEGLRAVLGRTSATAPRACGTSLIAANFTLNAPSSLDVTKNPDGTVSQVTLYGGGWGHNMGMSQYGAHGRGKLGQKFIGILKAYYTGVDIGSYPIDIGRDAGSGAPTLRQVFVAPNAAGVLEIRATDLKGLRVHVNELYDLTFDESTLAQELVQVDISDFLIAGLNVIQYNPVGKSGQATVNVVVQ
jgi:peptidoglycan hydrolase-like amidase